MKKIYKKGYNLLALTTIIFLGLVSTTYLVAADLQASTSKPTDVAFFGRSAWPEHRHFDISSELARGEDANQTLYAKIKNYKDQPVYVQAEFFINPAFGIPTHYTIYTAIELLNPSNYTVLTADFGPLSSGDASTYYVSARCLYSLDLEEWIQSDVKEFKFTIVP